MKQIKRGHYKEDEFQSTIEKLMKYVVRHKEKSIMIAVGSVAAVILIIFFFARGEQSDPQADLLHTQALGLMSAGQVEEAEKYLRDLTDKYPNTRPGKIGFYYLGVIAFHSGRFEEALGMFDRFLAKEKKSPLLRPSALMGAGAAAEGIKDYERAAKYYEQVTRFEDSPLNVYGKLAHGRVLGLMGDTGRSKEILQALLDSQPPDDVAADARYYISYFNQL